MSFLKGLEAFQARMEEEEVASQETSVDVEVRVAEEVEEATSIVEEATTIINDAEASEVAAEEVEALEHFVASIKKHGLTPQGLELINHKGALEAFSGMTLPAVESLDATGRNYEAGQEATEAGEGAIRRAMTAIKQFFINLWNRVKALAAKFVTYVTAFEGSIARSKKSVEGVEMDAEKAGKKTVGMSQATLKSMADSYSKVCKGNFDSNTAKTENGVIKMVEGKATDLTTIGLELKDGKLTTITPPAVTEKKEALKLSESGFTPASCASMYNDIAEAVKNMREVGKFAKVIESICKMGEAAANSASKSNGTDAKEEVKILQKNAGDASKIFGVLASKGGVIPRAYITACAAVKACDKGAAPAEKKEEKKAE